MVLFTKKERRLPRTPIFQRPLLDRRGKFSANARSSLSVRWTRQMRYWLDSGIILVLEPLGLEPEIPALCFVLLAIP